jgi:DHA1 family tetracycline resistance protein-like MFS transporter
MTDPAVPPAPATSNRTAMLVVFLVVFIDLLGFGVVLPLLPLVSDGYLGGESRLVRGAVTGGLFAVFSLMQFLFSPVWGRISDRVGRRPVLLVSLGGSVVFYALFAVACVVPLDQPWLAVGLMFASRVGAGIAGASVSTASAVIADSTPPEKRAKGMGLIGAAFGIGFTFGPLIAFAVLTLFGTGTRTDDTGLSLNPAFAWVPGATAAVLSLAALAIAFTRFRETLRPHAGPLPPRVLFSWSRTAGVLRDKAVGPLVLVYFLAIFAFANFESTLSLFTEKVFRFDLKQNFLVFAGVGCVLMVAQGGFYRRFAGKMSELSLLRAGLVMMTLGLGGLAVVAYFASRLGEAAGDFRWVMYAAAAVAVFGFAFVNPSVAALVSRRADPTRQGEVQGVNQSFAAFGRILGPLLGLMLFQADESRALPFAAAVGLLLLVAALLPFLGKTADRPA